MTSAKCRVRAGVYAPQHFCSPTMVKCRACFCCLLVAWYRSVGPFTQFASQSPASETRLLEIVLDSVLKIRGSNNTPVLVSINFFSWSCDQTLEDLSVFGMEYHFLAVDPDFPIASFAPFYDHHSIVKSTEGGDAGEIAARIEYRLPTTCQVRAAQYSTCQSNLHR